MARACDLTRAWAFWCVGSIAALLLRFRAPGVVSGGAGGAGSGGFQGNPAGSLGDVSLDVWAVRPCLLSSPPLRGGEFWGGRTVGLLDTTVRRGTKRLFLARLLFIFVLWLV